MCKTCNYIILCVGTEIDSCTFVPLPPLYHRLHSFLHFLKSKNTPLLSFILYIQLWIGQNCSQGICPFVLFLTVSLITQLMISDKKNLNITCVYNVALISKSFFYFWVVITLRKALCYMYIYSINVNNLPTSVILLPHSGLQFVS